LWLNLQKKKQGLDPMIHHQVVIMMAYTCHLSGH
jgi:hypothetical protein